MRSTVTNLHKKVVRPNISKLLEDDLELAKYVTELESDNDSLRRVVEEQRARIMELTYVGGFIEVCHDVNFKYRREPIELETRTTADKYRMIYMLYHKQLLNKGWPRVELSKQDIASARRYAITQAITERIYTPDKSRKSKLVHNKKNQISKELSREIMPSPYKVHPDMILGDEDHHFKILLAKKERKQIKKPGS